MERTNNLLGLVEANRIEEILKLDVNGRADVLGDRETRTDGYVNMMTKYGTSMDSSTLYEFAPEMIPNDQILVDHYIGNGLFTKIIDLPSDEAVKHGIALNIADTDVEDMVMQRLDDLLWEEISSQGIKWARLFGGAIAVMLIDDGGGLEDPLNYKRIKCIEDIYLYDRSCVTPDYFTGYSGYGNGKSAEYYTVSDDRGTFTVHESRCLTFRNGIVPRLTGYEEYKYWGVPEYVRIKRELMATSTSHGNANKLLDRSIQAIYKMKDLSAKLETEEGEDQVLRRIQIIDTAKGMLSSLVIDADGEDYDFKTAQLSGVKDVLDGSCNMLSAVTNIPQAILFGRSPAGENATGESDFENYYNYIEQIQKRMLKANLNRLIDIVIQELIAKRKIKERPDINLEFNPLWSMSETEQSTVDLAKAQAAQTRAQTAQMYCDMQALDPSEVRAGLAEAGEYNIETLLDDIPEDQLFETMPEESAEQESNTVQAEGTQEQEPINNHDGDDSVTAAAVLVLKNGKILCGVRKDNGFLCGPGGHIEDGEAPIQTAIRESKEEFGITPNDLKQIGMIGENNAEADTHRTAVYLCTEFDGTPKADNEEMIGSFSMTPGTIQSDYLFPPFAESIKLLKPAEIMRNSDVEKSDGCDIIKEDQDRPGAPDGNKNAAGPHDTKKKPTNFITKDGVMSVTDDTRVEGSKSGKVFFVIPAGAKIQKVKAFAGHGTGNNLVMAGSLEKRFPTGDVKGWSHNTGVAILTDINGKQEKRVVHWFEHEKVGQVKFKVKYNPCEEELE